MGMDGRLFGQEELDEDSNAPVAYPLELQE